MKNRGFTLIELLAVIVILAIIALIAVPIVLGIINDSKKSSEKESVKLYLDTVQKAITRQNLKEKYEPDKCTIKTDGNLECFSGETSLGILNIEMKGKTPTEGKIYFNSGKVNTVENIKYDGLFYQMSNGTISNGTVEKVSGPTYATLVSDAAPTGVSYGDKYTYKVNDTYTFNFYVLSVEGDKVHLIMDRNICEDGTVATETNTCLVAWHAGYGASNNNYGPDTAMTYLYNATKNWSNVPNMELTYTDENNSGTNYGYTGITTSNGVATITGKNGAQNTTIGTTSQPLKARLPKENEVSGTDGNHCTGSYGSCPSWLVNYLRDTATGTQASLYPNNEFISGIYNYWLLSSDPGNSVYAHVVSNHGRVSGSPAGVKDNYSSSAGVRPVITISKSDLQ